MSLLERNLFKKSEQNVTCFSAKRSKFTTSRLNSAGLKKTEAAFLFTAASADTFVSSKEEIRSGEVAYDAESTVNKVILDSVDAILNRLESTSASDVSAAAGAS